MSKVLRKASPWKATGEDNIPVAIYKMFPTAKEYLMNYIHNVLSGIIKVTEVDVRGKIILLFKSDDKNNPANHRPIALLNSEY